MVNRPDVHRTVPKVDHQEASGFKRGRRWRRERALFLARNPLCACGCNRLAEEVDHIIPAAEAPHLVWDWNNWQGLTEECHKRKTAMENSMRNSPNSQPPHGVMDGWAD